MAKLFTDTLIIGAGPSGVSAGISLQKAGVENVIIDRQKFPREKTCGGLVTKKTMKKISELLNGESKKEIKKAFCDSGKVIEIYFRGKRLTRSVLSERVYFVKREKFDHFLVNKYKDFGGRIYENEKNYKMDFDKRTATLENGDTLEYKNLIIADGALSCTREKLGYSKPTPGFCIESFVPKIQTPFSNEVKIFFGIINNGYAWAFPSGDEYCIGLGGVYCQDIDYIKSLRKLLKMLGIDRKYCKIRGAFVPYGETVEQSGGNIDTILAGDAAGLVDPVYGEGLYFAISSGMDAAKAITEDEGRGFKANYLKRIAPYEKIIKQGRRVQSIFFNKYFQAFFKRRVYRKNAFVRFFFENHVSEYRYSYRELLRLYIDYKKSRKID